MDDQVLSWVDPIIRQKFLTHPKVVGYSSGSKQKLIFVKVEQISNKKRQACTITETFGYEAQADHPELIYPIACISVRLQVRELELLHRLNECLNYYKDNPIQGLQRLYQKRKEYQKQKEENNYALINFSCEAYFFTLQDVIALLKRDGRLISKNTANFFRGFFLKAYRTALEMLNSCPPSAYGLSFSLKARDVLVDQFFRPLLRHPFARYPHPNLAFTNNKEERFINPRIRNQILETSKTLNVVTNSQQTPFYNDAYHQSMAIFESQRQIYKINDELARVNETLRSLPSVPEFPDRSVLEELRSIMGDLYHISPLAKNEIDRLRRDQRMLEKLVQKKYHL